jgi:amino acid adenylation domain-containing protein
VVIVADLDPEMSFRQLLGEIRETLLEAYSAQRYPFQRLARDLGMNGNGQLRPLFEVALALDDIHGALPEIDNALTLTFTSRAETLDGRIEFDAGLFRRESVERFGCHLVNLLSAALDDTGKPIAALDMLAETERRQILEDWNRTRADYPRAQCLQQLFEAQARETPEAVAVVQGETRVTYGELNRRANQLAHHLRRLEVTSESLVGICMTTSAEMLVGVLGTMKAGGAYVPLSPTDPAARLGFILADAQVRVLLTERRLEPSLPAHDARVVCLDAELETTSGESAENPRGLTTPQSLAYVIYTSGSTGQPKGSMVSHASLVNYLCWVNRDLTGDGARVLPALTRLSFDASLKQLLAPLLRGDHVWMIPEATAERPAALLRALGRSRGSGLNCVPSLWRAILDEATPEELAAAGDNFSSLMLGGEALTPELVGRTLDALPRLRIWNLYGPTEATANAAAARVNGPDRISIGRPVSNTQLYLLDKHLRPAPVGVAGEIFIGGDGLARGYLKRPALTAERFVPNPFGAAAGARLYRTGDVGRYMADGRVEYLGRLDEQVKVRGYRVELGEIEAALRQHAGVGECVVVAREDEAGDKRLTAYVAAGRQARPTVNELRGHLRGRLPEYMMPGAFVMLDALPLMHNGKVDRRALPAPHEVEPESGHGFVAPRTPTEEMLSSIFASVLKVGRVGAYDNFFELGGHSLLATRLISRIREEFRTELPLRSLFDHPTVAELSRSVEAAIRAGRGTESPPIAAVPRGTTLPLSFAQQRLWFLSQLEPDNPAYNVPTALRLRGRLNVEALTRAISEIIRRHEVLRTSFVFEDGEPVQSIAPAAPLKLEVVDLGGLGEEAREAEAQRLAREEAQRPFDLSKGAAFRARMLRLGGDDHVALFTMHHIVSDGWSMGILVGELEALYRAFAEGLASPLPEPPIQYADFAVWQRAWLRGEALGKQLDYWRGRLGGAGTALKLPTDRPASAVRGPRGAAYTSRLPETLVAELKALSRREGCTLFMTLLAAFKALLQRYSAQADIIVGTPIANRNRAELEGLIGFFVNTLALRTDFSGNPTFREALRRVRETTLGAYAHQDAPFEMLVEELQPERSLTEMPWFQVFFAMQNAPRETLRIGGLQLSELSAAEPSAKFPLNLVMVEEGQDLFGSWTYSADLFEEATIREMSRRFETLLRHIVAQPDARLDALEIFTREEKERQSRRERELIESSYRKFMSAKPKPVRG